MLPRKALVVELSIKIRTVTEVDWIVVFVEDCCVTISIGHCNKNLTMFLTDVDGFIFLHLESDFDRTFCCSGCIVMSRGLTIRRVGIRHGRVLSRGVGSLRHCRLFLRCCYVGSYGKLVPWCKAR